MFTIAEIVKDALWRQKVRKRHKNNKKNYFRNVKSNGGWHLAGDNDKFWSIGKNYNHKRRSENKRIIKDQCF